MTTYRNGQRVQITGGMSEFVGKTGTIIDRERDGQTVLYRVELDEPVEIEGVGTVEDDLWSAEFLKLVRSADVDLHHESDLRAPAVKYPEISVQLTGNDGNAFMVMGRVTQAMRRAGISQDERDAFRSEATSGDYDNLLATCMRWVDCH